VALLQTFQPEHPVIRAILGGDEEAFWRAEAAEREAAGMPPYGRLAGIIISAGDAASAFDLGQHLARNDEAIRRRAASSMDPRPAPIARVRGRHRVRLLVKAPKGAPLQAAISRWIGGIKAAFAGAACGGYRPAEFLLIGRPIERRLQVATGRIRPPANVNECHKSVMSVSIRPKPGILDIALYQGGESKLPGFVAPLKLSSNENPFGPRPRPSARWPRRRRWRIAIPRPTTRGCAWRCQRSTVSTPSGSSAGSGRTRSSRFLCQAYAGGGRGALSRARVRDVPHLGAGVGATPVTAPEKERVVDPTRSSTRSRSARG
jgi:hypothetical protein